MRPSADSSLPQTPNIAPSDPASGKKNPQSKQMRLVERAIADSGPWSPVCHRSAASARPQALITQRRPRPSSAAVSSTCGSPLAV
jgi:hypothetical protein